MEPSEAKIIVAMFVVFIIVIILIMVFWLHRTDPKLPRQHSPTEATFSLIPEGSIINCQQLGTEVTGSITCKQGMHNHEGVCYKDVWSQEGGSKVATCTIDYGASFSSYTNCSVGIQELEQGAPCSMVGPGYHKTGPCTCQYKGVVTAPLYCQSEGRPNQCPPGSDFLEGKCYSSACPHGYVRTNKCVCSPM